MKNKTRKRKKNWFKTSVSLSFKQVKKVIRANCQQLNWVTHRCSFFFAGSKTRRCHVSATNRFNLLNSAEFRLQQQLETHSMYNRNKFHLKGHCMANQHISSVSYVRNEINMKRLQWIQRKSYRNEAKST